MQKIGFVIAAVGVAFATSVLAADHDLGYPGTANVSSPSAADSMRVAQMAGMPGHSQPAANSSGTYSATGSIAAVAGKQVTIKHGPVAALNWPAMTMAFQADDPSLVRGLKPGDEVAFSFRQDGGQYTLTSIERAKP